ncbi:MAG: hypothetical protein AAF601_02125 [Pseudomonadota bacterium]
MTRQHGPTVRQFLARATRDIHETLHHDPILSRLNSTHIRPDEYHAALTILGRFVCAVERERLRYDLFAAFTLDPLCTAVSADLGGPLAAEAPLALRDPAALLGALYVAHGAAFGRNSFRKTVTRALPEMRHAFVNLRMATAQWQGLIAALEEAGEDPAGLNSLLLGAQSAFDCVRHLCDAAPLRPVIAE